MIKNKKIFKLGISAATLLTLSTPLMGSISANADSVSSSQQTDSSASAQQNNEKAPSVTLNSSNQLFKDAQNEINSINSQNLSSSEKSQKIQNVMHKYDGAEDDLTILPASSATLRGIQISLPSNVKEKIVDGGVNDYAYTKGGLRGLRSYYGTIGTEAGIAGASIASMFSGPLGTIAGYLAGNNVLGARANDAQSDIKSMISKGKSKGGCRMTLTDEFPIPYLSSEDEV